MAEKWQRIRLDIPDSLNKAERVDLASEIIDFIIDRTQDGLSVRNKKFRRYTKEYAETKGVSPTDVDLTLTGDMLDDMRLLSEKKGSLLIGFSAGTFSNDKAAWNRETGRPFLGITKKDLKGLV